MKLSFWFLKYRQQELAAKLSGSAHLQIRAAKLKDIGCLADILADSFHSRAGLSGWFYPLFRMGIYEDLRQRLQTSSGRYVCLVGAYGISGTPLPPSSESLKAEAKTDASSGGEKQIGFIYRDAEEDAEGSLSDDKGDFLAGTAELTLRSNNPWLFSGSPQYPYVSNLAVRSSCRRRGVAEKLLLSCEQIALDWGFRDIYLHVLENNSKARRLYSKLGYQLYKVDSSWTCFLLGQPRRFLLHKRLM